MADQVWDGFRRLPLFVQVIGWLFFFWVLVPLLIWRTSLGRGQKLTLTGGFLVLLVVVGASGQENESTPESRPLAEQPDESSSTDFNQGEDELEPLDEENGDEADKPDAEQARKRRPRGRVALVTRVIDGDTIEVELGGRIVDIRFIGVDTPETVHPSEPVECFGPAASDFTTSSLQGKQVRLEFDVERLDRYGRTLAYAWAGSKLFNEMLVERGFAQVSTYPSNVKYEDRFVSAQSHARNRDRGLWGSCPAGGSDSKESGGSDGGGGSGSGKCDPNYEGACIPPYPPDLDCTEISASGFRSVGSDPHGFDADADGIACE